MQVHWDLMEKNFGAWRTAVNENYFIRPWVLACLEDVSWLILLGCDYEVLALWHYILLVHWIWFSFWVLLPWQANHCLLFLNSDRHRWWYGILILVWLYHIRYMTAVICKLQCIVRLLGVLEWRWYHRKQGGQTISTYWITQKFG